jgi:CCR4-NOT transcription complex subunit 1
MNHQFSWGSTSQQQSGRRGIPPISTAFPSGSSRNSTSSNSPSRQTFSPSSTSFPTLPSARNVASHTSSASSTSSPYQPILSGTQQLQSGQLLPSARLRTIASSSNPQLASSAAALPSAAQGGGGASSSGGGAPKLARASPSLSQSSTVASPNSSTNPTNLPPPGQSLAKIVIAQVFFLLSGMKDDKDQQKWDSQVEQIHKVTLPVKLSFTISASHADRGA